MFENEKERFCIYYETVTVHSYIYIYHIGDLVLDNSEFHDFLLSQVS